MTKFEEQAVNLVRELLPNFKKLEFRATIGDTSRSIEFFVWLDDERQQCYELADNGIIDEEKMEKLFDDYAKFVRGNSEYKAGKVNKVQFDFDPTKDV